VFIALVLPSLVRRFKRKPMLVAEDV
jgi:hypothetical protein